MKEDKMMNQELNEEFDEQMIVLVDEDGTERSFELVASLDIEDKNYVLLAENEESDDVYAFIVSEDENGEMTLSPVEDEAEFAKVAEAYDALFDEEGCDCGCGEHHHE